LKIDKKRRIHKVEEAMKKNEIQRRLI